MGETGSEGRSVEERVLGPSLRKFLGRVESIDLVPEVEHVMLSRRNVDRLGGCIVSYRSEHFNLRSCFWNDMAAVELDADWRSKRFYLKVWWGGESSCTC